MVVDAPGLYSWQDRLCATDPSHQSKNCSARPSVHCTRLSGPHVPFSGFSIACELGTPERKICVALVRCNNGKAGTTGTHVATGQMLIQN
jgi:hypothetical protein